jgi:hypothetical protein
VLNICQLFCSICLLAERERLERPETIELVRLYYAIPDPRMRKQFLEMVKAAAASR